MSNAPLIDRGYEMPTMMTRLKNSGRRSMASALLAVSLSGCYSVSELELSQDTVDHLPKDVALDFLMSMVDRGWPVSCVFQPDGVERISGGNLIPGKQPYPTLTARPYLPGLIEINVTGKSQGFFRCVFGGVPDTSRLGLSDKVFTKKALTALLALGVQVPAEGKQSIAPRKTNADPHGG